MYYFRQLWSGNYVLCAFFSVAAFCLNRIIISLDDGRRTQRQFLMLLSKGGVVRQVVNFYSKFWMMDYSLIEIHWSWGLSAWYRVSVSFLFVFKWCVSMRYDTFPCVAIPFYAWICNASRCFSRRFHAFVSNVVWCCSCIVHIMILCKRPNKSQK